MLRPMLSIVRGPLLNIVPCSKHPTRMGHSQNGKDCYESGFVLADIAVEICDLSFLYIILIPLLILYAVLFFVPFWVVFKVDILLLAATV